jgi:hypothetical protein
MSVSFEDVYELIQPDFAARLQSLDFFGDIAVAAPRVWKEGEKVNTPKSITERIDQTLTGLYLSTARSARRSGSFNRP